MSTKEFASRNREEFEAALATLSTNHAHTLGMLQSCLDKIELHEREVKDLQETIKLNNEVIEHQAKELMLLRDCYYRLSDDMARVPGWIKALIGIDLL